MEKRRRGRTPRGASFCSSPSRTSIFSSVPLRRRTSCESHTPCPWLTASTSTANKPSSSESGVAKAGAGPRKGEERGGGAHRSDDQVGDIVVIGRGLVPGRRAALRKSRAGGALERDATVAFMSRRSV